MDGGLGQWPPLPSSGGAALWSDRDITRLLLLFMNAACSPPQADLYEEVGGPLTRYPGRYRDENGRSGDHRRLRHRLSSLECCGDGLGTGYGGNATRGVGHITRTGNAEAGNNNWRAPSTVGALRDLRHRYSRTPDSAVEDTRISVQTPQTSQRRSSTEQSRKASAFNGSHVLRPAAAGALAR